MKRFQRAAGLALALILVCGAALPAAAAGRETLDAAIKDTAAALCRTVTTPQFGSVGGEWAVLALARGGCTVPDGYFERYYAGIEKEVADSAGQLHDKKYTEYSRLIVTLTAMGKDARDVGGYDLTVPLGDYDKTVWQGMNGPIWALLALDSGNYPMPENEQAATQATRQMYVDRILQCQLPDGGWSLRGGTDSATAADGTSEPDVTGMALQALAKYQDQPAVRQATEEALACMSAKQNAQGGFNSWGTVNVESCVQMLVALTELGLPLDDPRFVKNGSTLLDNLLRYYRPGAGFAHTEDGGEINQMATEQGLYAMVAAQRALDGKNSLYRMDDAAAFAGVSGAGKGLAGKHDDVTFRPVTKPGKTFDDISGEQAHPNQPAIEALAAREIIDGKGEGRFDPDAGMTRAEFAAIVVRALGLEPEPCDAFSDVGGQWFAPYVGTAYRYKIVNGKGAGMFEPESGITRQEAAAMVARAAGLCGMDTTMETAEIRNVLAQFADYVQAESWARESLAFCYKSGILDDSVLNIEPKAEILRCEIAQMLYNLLRSANLL